MNTKEGDNPGGLLSYFSDNRIRKILRRSKPFFTILNQSSTIATSFNLFFPCLLLSSKSLPHRYSVYIYCLPYQF